MDYKVIIELFENSIKDIAILDKDANFIYANESYLNRTGYTKEELIGQNAAILKSGKHNTVFYKNLWTSLSNNQNFNAVFTNKNKNGTLYYEEQIIIPITEVGEEQTYLVIGKDSSSEIVEQLNSICQQDI